MYSLCMCMHIILCKLKKHTSTMATWSAFRIVFCCYRFLCECVNLRERERDDSKHGPLMVWARGKRVQYILHIYCTYYINCKYKKCKCAWHIKRWVGAIKQWRRVRQKGATRSRAECKDASTVPRLQVRPNCQKMQQTTEGEAEKPYAMQKWGLPCLPRTLRTIPAELFN